MAVSMLVHNLDAINHDGSVTPVPGENPHSDEPGHVAYALGEYYRATGETTLKSYDLIDLAARTITAQTFTEPASENGLAYASLGLLTFGPVKESNPVWERLVDETRQRLDKQLLYRRDYENYWQVFNIAKAVCHFSLGFSKKDETSFFIERMVDRINQTSSTGFFDDITKGGIGGHFNLHGVMTLVFTRSALQLHINSAIRERKFPTLNTCTEKYIKLMSSLVRADGLGWAYGKAAGVYGQMHCISIILQAMCDALIPDDKKPKYFDLLRRLFYFFFQTHIDQEHGALNVRDEERTACAMHTTRIANFDAACYLCQWSHLAKAANVPLGATKADPVRTTGRFVIFDKSNRKEQGLFLYHDAESGLQVQFPLVSSGDQCTSDNLAFPHSPGIFDWPNSVYLPVMLPELTFGDQVTVPAFYGQGCVTGLGPKNSFYFRYEQPELINTKEQLVRHIGSVRVQWVFAGNKVNAEFAYKVKSQVQLDKFRFSLVVGTPHSKYRVSSSIVLGKNGHRCSVLKNDFHANWQETKVVTNDPAYRTNYGKLHYVQNFTRPHPLTMLPSQIYRLSFRFDPDLAFLED